MKKLILALTLLGAITSAYANSKSLTVYKDENCSCCEEWVLYMRKAGYEVKTVNTPEMSKVKEKYSVPLGLQSCHTAVVDSTQQVIEGHVPVAAVEKMLKNPKIKGISVPGMKSNSPGMGVMNGQLVTYDFQDKEFSKN